MKLLVLGGTRFIGCRTVELAIERGHDVTVVHRGVHNANLPGGVRSIRADRDEVRSFIKGLRTLEADVVLDTFAMTSTGARHAIEAIRSITENVVVLSSQDVYAQFGRLNGLPAPAPEDLVRETSPLTVPFPFRSLANHEGGADYDKKEVELVYQEAVGEVFQSAIILRLPVVYGSDDYQQRFKSLLDALDAGVREFPCQGNASWRLTKAHVTNVAHAILLAAEKRLAGYRVFNAGELHVPTMRGRLEKISSLMGFNISWKEAAGISADFALLGKMRNDFVVDTSKIREHLGYQEILDEDECYLDLIDWIRLSRK